MASTRIASVSPVPNKRITATWAAINAANEIAMISAAAVITRPVWAKPRATLSSLSADVFAYASQNSRIREIRNTS